MPRSGSPKVSIVIPVYNGANYLRIAIESALAQTYDNIEIIVVDDGSTDNTAAIGAEYGKKIRFFSKPNGGCASALNFGIAKMTGDYFSWLSHDDVYMPDKIELQVKSLQEQKDKNTVIYSSFSIINSDSHLMYTVHIDRQIPEKKRDLPFYALLDGLIYGCAILIPAVYFSTIGRFDETLRHTQDYDFFLKLFRRAPLHFCNNVLVHARKHPAQDSRPDDSIKSKERRDECKRFWIEALDSLTDAEMSQMDGTPYAFLRRITQSFARTDCDEACFYAHNRAEQRLLDTKISVIIPLYNDIKGALRAIYSVMAQTHQNFEIIVVDDGSTEDVRRVVERVSSDQRMKYVAIPNGGYSNAVATGASMATGRYIVALSTNQQLPPMAMETHLRCKADDLLQDNPNPFNSQPSIKAL